MCASTIAIETVFREEWGRILATLIGRCNSFDEAEDALQDAFAEALAKWPGSGFPQNPGAWLTTTAYRKLIDAARRRSTRARVLSDVERTAAQDVNMEPGWETFDWPDDRLRLIFTCCHPALHQEAQIALCLRTLGGLTTGEVAKAFLIPEATLAQRLVRAKRKIRAANIPYAVPSPEHMADRLSVVAAVIYLIFNEGYLPASGTALVRTDLCAEAIRLARLLTALLPQEAEARGLLALLLLQHSRRDARTDRHGDLIVLEEQDRTQWHSGEIQEGIFELAQATKLQSLGPYQLQAAIAAVHAQAHHHRETDWRTIALLYGRLRSWGDGPVVRLNQAVAVGMSEGVEKGLELLDELARAGELQGYHLLPAAQADLLRRLGRPREAEAAYRRALCLVGNGVERRFLQGRLQSLPEQNGA